MDESKDQPEAREDVVHRAQHLAKDAAQMLPAWLQPGNPESRWPVLVALLSAIVMQGAIPRRYTVVPRWPLLAMEIALVVVLLIINPVRLTRATKLGKGASLLLLAAITIDNTASAVVLDYHILTGTVSNDAALLLGSGIYTAWDLTLWIARNRDKT